MKKIPFRRFAKIGKSFLVKHSADILTGFTAAGVVITAIETHKATRKVDEFLRANGYELANEDTKKVLKFESAKHYILPVATGALTIGAAIGANYINHRQIAGLAAACTVAETALSEHRDKIEELMGDKALAKIDDEMLADKGRVIAANNGLSMGLIDTGHGDEIIIDGLTGMIFLTSWDWILHCVNEFGERVNNDLYCSYGEYLEIVCKDCKEAYHIPKWTYEKGYGVHITGIMNMKTPHYEGEAGKKPYLVYEPYNAPVSNYTEILS
jgi:hypothetical protein